MASKGTISRRLRTLDHASPTASRAELCRALMEAGESDFAGFFTLVPDAEVEFRYAALAVVGDEGCVETLGVLEGSPFDSLRSWRPDAPPPLEVGRFTSMRRTRSAAVLAQTESYRRHYVPLGVQDQARMLVYRGPELVGWIGVMRLADRPRYDEDELRRLNTLSGEVTSALIACDARERLNEREAPATILLRSDGTVDFATPAARTWLEVYGTEPLRRAMKDLHDEAPRATVAVGIHRVGMVRMDSCRGRGVRYLATVERAATASATPFAGLSRRQQQVASYAAVGATTPEIARALGVSTETVRSQLKSIYRSLGIGSRAELATLVSAHGEE